MVLCGEIRGGPNFGPVKYVKEVSHVYANSLLVHPNFSSKLMMTQTYFWSTFKLIENSLLVQFELMKWTKSKFSNHSWSCD